MQDEKLRQRIDQNPRAMAGTTVSRGTRLTVEYVVNLLAHGASEQEVQDEYERLLTEDMQACMLWPPNDCRGALIVPDAHQQDIRAEGIEPHGQRE